jgi:hypothetical protein
MRTIKFRGQRIDNGEWVYGYLYQLPLPTGVGCMILTTNNTHEDNSIEPEYHLAFTLWVDLFPVKPETVGQYTEQKDKNSQEIYDGDVLRNIDGLKRVGNEWIDNVHIIPVEYKEARFNISCLSKVLEYTEVIGNIYDNPELLNKKLSV